MKKDDAFIELRKEAEKLLNGQRVEEANPDLAKLIHELEVHQVELDLQNDELRRTQKELETSRNEYYSLFDSAPVGFVTIDAKGIITRINHTAEEMLDFRGKCPLIGQGFSSLVHPADTSLYFSFLTHIAVNRGGKASFELRMKASHGVIYVRVEATATSDEAGGSSSWHFAISDITKQKQAEAALKDRTTELEMKNRELQDFVFVASHDLAEPLRKIRTFGRMLTERCGRVVFDEVCKDYLGRMQTGAARMQDLLYSLLLYSRVTTKAEPLKETDLGECVEGALSNLEIVIGEKNAEVEVGKLPTVRADQIQMIQLFQNLIGNALKFSRDGVTPHIKIYAQEDRHENGVYEIFVEDNGIGFDQRYVDKIFQPFQRLDGRSSEYGGAGMGLAICKKIVERHGGRITARSELGKSSTFVVTLPAERKTGKK
jgi:PAS domain S-box-containing protein